MKRSRSLTWLLWLIPLVFLLYFFYQPLLAIFRQVFSERFNQGWQFFSWDQVSQPLVFTLWQALLSTLLTLLVGLPAAYLFARFDFAGRKGLHTLSLLPFILPTVVVATAFNTLIGPRGWLNLILMDLFNLSSPPIQLLNSLPAILLAHIFYNTSIIIRMVGNSLSRLNPHYEEAARVLNATPWQAFKEVSLPLLMPTILGASLLVFLFDFTSFGVVLMLGGSQYATLEVEIYNQAMNRFNLPMAGLLSIIQLLVTLLITLAQNRVRKPRFGKAALSGERKARHRPTDKWQKTFVVIMVILLLVLFVSPILSLVTRSFVTFEAARGERGEFQTGFTTRYYSELLQNRSGSIFYANPLAAIRNSLVYSVITMVIATSLGLISAYALSRSGKFTRWLEPLFMLPLGASAVILGLGFLLTFNKPPWTSGPFPILIPIAHSLIALPFVVRTLLPAIQGIPNSLREAARVMGAKPWEVFQEIDLPILLRAMIVSLAFSFTISLGEFGASSFLANARTPTIPVTIFRYISQPGALNYGQALAMSTLLLITSAAGSLLIEKIRLPGEELF
ncbi:MAG: iron ABC transporter permease [Anaerolineaceae bacterium]|nr:iron ABC transporter permease [Anaerolineaceae bacterium]MDD4043411.1 iron ABC transporter permease [Anaerolineaceae bacterium]MDD4578005.1 iron ABC transporter permease [Anaerolineaceae bacterium]